MTDYTYLSDMRNLMNTDLDESQFVARVRGLIRQLSATVELSTFRRFDHRVATVPHNARRVSDKGDVSEDGYTLLLRDDLQSASSITNGGVELAIDDYQLMPYNMPVYRPFRDKILMTGNSTFWNNVSGVRSELSIMVSGIWGWGGTWKRITTLSAAAPEADNTVALNSVSRVEYGKILRIDSEYMEVDDETDTLVSPVSVVRGANESEIADHLIDAAVYSFTPHPTISRLVQRLVMWQSELDDSPLFGTVELGDFSQPVDLTNAPKDTKEIIAMLSSREDPNA